MFVTYNNKKYVISTAEINKTVINVECKYKDICLPEHLIKINIRYSGTLSIPNYFDTTVENGGILSPPDELFATLYNSRYVDLDHTISSDIVNMSIF